MIFVTTGSMLPFDRLITLMDAWAKDHPHTDVFAQIGDGRYVPRHMPHVRTLAPADFKQRVRDSTLIVAHAGMGSIITALETGRPIIVLPRRAEHREHTSDHQFHAAGWLHGKPGIQMVQSGEELGQAIEHAMASGSEAGAARLSARAPDQFTDRLRQFLLN